MKYMFIIAALFFVGCDSAKEEMAKTEAKNQLKKDSSYHVVCIEGVSYVKYAYTQFRSGYFGLTVMLGKDSKVILCESDVWLSK